MAHDNIHKKTDDGTQLTLLAYKLSYDILFLLIISFAAALLLESVLPGMVSDNGGFLIISVIAFASVWSISTIGKKMRIGFKSEPKNGFLPFVVAFSFVLVGNALLKFSLWENILITTATVTVFFIFYRSLFSHHENKS